MDQLKNCLSTRDQTDSSPFENEIKKDTLFNLRKKEYAGIGSKIKRRNMRCDTEKKDQMLLTLDGDEEENNNNKRAQQK